MWGHIWQPLSVWYKLAWLDPLDEHLWNINLCVQEIFFNMWTYVHSLHDELMSYLPSHFKCTSKWPLKIRFFNCCTTLQLCSFLPTFLHSSWDVFTYLESSWRPLAIWHLSLSKWSLLTHMRMCQGWSFWHSKHTINFFLKSFTVQILRVGLYYRSVWCQLSNFPHFNS